MSQPDDPPYQLPPYAAPSFPAGSPPRSSSIASFIAAGFATAIVLLLFVEFFAQAGAIATNDFGSFGLASSWVLVIGALLGIGAVVAGGFGLASRRKVVLAGVALGIGASELLGAFWNLVAYVVHAVQSAF